MKSWNFRRAGIAAVAALTLAACSSGGSKGGVTTITLEGPNQWTNSGSTFGPAWDKLIAKFEKENPKIKVKTVVLPLDQFNQTISTQLAAGTAPDLVFNQASYKPYMVHHLDADLKKPNPYVAGKKAWINQFNSKYFGLKNAHNIDPEGHVDWVPFNLVAVGVFYNKDAFKKAGVHAPVTTFADLLADCGKLKAAGYTPFAMDDSDIGTGWTWNTIANMLLAKYYDKLNVYDAAGNPGSNPQLTAKDWAKAILTKQITPTMPEVTESLKLMKQFYDSCASKNWSGIAGSSGAMVNIKDFASGEAAMSWGTDYAPAALPGVKFPYGSMPFPTITRESTPLSTNAPAQFGVAAGGTSYMIPAKISGDKLKAALKFMQWMSVGKNIQQWLNETGAIPAVTDATVPTQTKGLTQGTWSEAQTIGGISSGPPGTTVVSLYDGYLLGSKNLSAEQAHLEDMWTKAQVQAVKDNGWTGESWAKNAK